MRSPHYLFLYQAVLALILALGTAGCSGMLKPERITRPALGGTATADSKGGVDHSTTEGTTTTDSGSDDEALPADQEPDYPEDDGTIQLPEDQQDDTNTETSTTRTSFFRRDPESTFGH